MKIKTNISLIGMPAAGKSTIGVLLAKKMGYAFLDTDISIQTGEKMTLAQIIDARGIEAFLDIEADYLSRLTCRNHVIATGGSVIYRDQAMAHLASISTIIYLAADLDTLLSRLSDLTARGVAIDPKRDIADLYKERTVLYDQYCDVKIDCGTMGPAEMVNAVEKALSGVQKTRSTPSFK